MHICQFTSSALSNKQTKAKSKATSQQTFFVQIHQGTTFSTCTMQVGNLQLEGCQAKLVYVS